MSYPHFRSFSSRTAGDTGLGGGEGVLKDPSGESQSEEEGMIEGMITGMPWVVNKRERERGVPPLCLRSYTRM